MAYKAITEKSLISFIIPTHNRSHLLHKLLEDLIKFSINSLVEILVVDNNSTDKTKEVAQKFSDNNVRYVFEGNTSFTKARGTGAREAKGDVIVFLDDDIVISQDIATPLRKVFAENSKAAVVGVKIVPKFEKVPPAWVLDLQESFNGYSLYDLGDEERIVDAVPGPFMAIRKSAYDEVGGFPPDTIGVETNTGKRSFKKLYIGPGDYGFCLKCRDRGYQVIYMPSVVIGHMVLTTRLTKEFWVSRMVGEGHCLALSYDNMAKLYNKYHKNDLSKSKNYYKFLQYSLKSKMKRLVDRKTPLLADELWYLFYKSLIDMEHAIANNPGLSKYLWELGVEGVADKNFDAVLQKLPDMYKNLTLS